MCCMKKKFSGILFTLIVGVLTLFPVSAYAEAHYCQGRSFFGLKPWYAYLTCESNTIRQENFSDGELPTTVWKVALTILNDLLFLAGLLAVVLIIYSGFQFVTSSGDPATTAKAKKSLTNTVIGLAIVLLAQLIVNTILIIITGDSGGQF